MKFPQQKFRRILLLAGIAVLPLSGCYATTRLLSPRNAVKVFVDQTADNNLGNPALTVLRIGAYNIAHGRGSGSDNWNGGDKGERTQRLHDIARFLRDAKLEVVVLNEVDFDSSWSNHVNQAKFLAREAGFPFWLEQRNIDAAVPFYSWKFGNAILSKYPISSARLIDFPAYSSWEAVAAGKKKGVVCTIDLPGNQQVRVLAVHLSHRSEQTRIAAARMIERERQQAGPPLIAAGDFNSTPVTFPTADGPRAGQTALSLLIEEGGFTSLPNAFPSMAELTFSSTEPSRVIDWVLVAEPLQLISKEVYPLQFSDHRPVIGVVRWVSERRAGSDQ
jgi:endonuclease/exonuclease/phosphatase family metal-dependent hydrolase